MFLGGIFGGQITPACILISWIFLEELPGGKHNTVEDAKQFPGRRNKMIFSNVLSTPSGHFPQCVFAKESPSTAKYLPLWQHYAESVQCYYFCDTCSSCILLYVTFLLTQPGRKWQVHLVWGRNKTNVFAKSNVSCTGVHKFNLVCLMLQKSPLVSFCIPFNVQQSHGHGWDKKWTCSCSVYWC